MDAKRKDQRESGGQIESTPLLIVDCNYLCHRAKHSMAGLSFHEKQTGVLYGFLSTVRSLALKFNSNRFAFAWDSQKSLRKKIYPQYKYKRAEVKSPEERELDALAHPQFSLLRTRILPKLGFKNVFIRTGYEADDLIAGLVNDNNPPQDKIVITSDDDLLQLLERCNIYNLTKKELITRKDFEKEYGVRPQSWIVIKSLAGCASDGIRGIEGVGIVKALQYVRGELTKGIVYDRIKREEEIIKEVNYKLIYLPFDGLGEIDLRNGEVFYQDDFLDICEEYDFRSFLRKETLFDWKEVFNMR